MRITEKQAEVLENLHRVAVTTGPRRTQYSLDGRNCRNQIVGLAAKGILKWDGQGKPSKVVAAASVVVVMRQDGIRTIF